MEKMGWGMVLYVSFSYLEGYSSSALFLDLVLSISLQDFGKAMYHQLTCFLLSFRVTLQIYVPDVSRLPSWTSPTGELADYGCRSTFRCYGHQCPPPACVKLAVYPRRLTIAMDRAIRIVASGVLLSRLRSHHRTKITCNLMISSAREILN